MGRSISSNEVTGNRDGSTNVLSRHPSVSYVIVIGMAGVVLFWRLGLPTLEGHECYVPLVASHMANGGRWLDEESAVGPLSPNTPWNHWLVPVFNGQPRMVKTPLAYWFEAVLLRMGFPLNEFTARVPSAICATLLALLTLALGRRMFSPRVGLTAAIMLLTTLGVQQWGRNARPEMMTSFWMTAVMFCFYSALKASSPGRRNALLMAVWFCTGMANLAKEFVPWFLLLPLLSYFAWHASRPEADETGRPLRLLAVYLVTSVFGLVILDVIRATPALNWWKYAGLGESLGLGLTLAAAIGTPLGWYLLAGGSCRQLKLLLPTALPGIALMLLMFVPWLWYMTKLFPSATGVLQTQVMERALSTGFTFNGKKPGFYCFSLLVLSMPWSVVVPAALAMPFLRRFRENRDALVFQFLWIFGLILLFSAATGKRQHYILPALPAVCLLAGSFAEDLFFQHRWFSLRWARVFVAGCVGALLIGLIGTAVFLSAADAAQRSTVLHVLVIAGVVLVFFCVSLAAIWKGRTSLALAMVLLGAVAGSVAYAARGDLWEEEPDSIRIANQARKMLPVDGRVASWGDVRSKIVYYLGRDIPNAWARRDKLVGMHGLDAGLRLWKEWLESDRPPLLLFGHREDIPELAQLGFAPVQSDWARGISPREPVLFRFRRVPAPTVSPP